MERYIKNDTAEIKKLQKCIAIVYRKNKSLKILVNKIEKKAFFDLNYISHFYKDIFAENDKLFRKKIYKSTEELNKVLKINKKT